MEAAQLLGRFLFLYLNSREYIGYLLCIAIVEHQHILMCLLHLTTLHVAVCHHCTRSDVLYKYQFVV